MDLVDLAYDFGLGTADNGDVKAIVNNRDTTRTQYFSYDGLNRIALANSQASTGGNAWGQAFGYDPWGNLNNVTVTQGSASALSVSVNANNQFAGTPYSYDAAGNMLTDGVSTYTWNAEEKVATAENSLYGTETYVYDGDGRRVEKEKAGKLYWYGTDGQVLAESDLSGNITDEYVFFGGERMARVDASGKVDYYLSDSLSSSRVVADANGNILDDCDFLPFGAERCITSSSGNHYKFTGKERDPETGDDHFAARNYENTMGRWLSPDPDNAGSDSSDPQTWNAYAYAGNNPTTNADPTGEDYRICVATMQATQANCVNIPSDEAFQAALANPGAGITIQGNQGSGTIYGTDANGQQVLVGSYQHFIGPGEEGGGLQDATGDLIAFAGGVGGAVRGAVALGEEGINAIGRMLGVGGEEEAAASAPVGVRGSPLQVAAGTNADQVVDGINYSGHALDQMQSEGIMPSVVKDAVENGSEVPTYGDRVVHLGDGVKVITDRTRKVITVMLQSR